MTSRVVHLPGLESANTAEPLPVDQDITASAIIDLNGMIQSVNSDFTSLVRYSRYDLASMRWTDCGHPDDTDTEASVMADLLVGTVSNAQIPRRLIAKDGTVVYGSLRLSPLRDAQGEPISLFAVFTAFATSGAGNRDDLPAPLADNVSVLPYAGSSGDAVAESDVLRALARCTEEHLGGGAVGVLLEEVVLHFPGVVVAQAIGQLDLLE